MKYWRLTLAILLGMAVPSLGVWHYSFFRLAYQQNALSAEWISVSSRILVISEWPCLLVDGVGIPVATNFYDPHFVGSLFWSSLFEYLFVNFIGWSLLVYLALRIASYLLSRLSAASSRQYANSS